MRGFLQGLCAIHELDYIHRDIKPENIMLGALNLPVSEEDVRIVDFGLSAKQKLSRHRGLEEKIGTILYMAPEQISQKKYTKKIDIYATGVMIY